MASERLQRQIQRLLDEAEAAIVHRDWGAVLERAQDVLAIDPQNSEGLAFHATAERALGGSIPPAANPAAVSPVAPSSQQPTSFSNGRYQVKRFLGEGGKKKVYLATDTLLDRDVAFALIKTEGLDEVSRTRITREAQAMGRLGSHPHIVTVFDLGDHQGQPFMVTELMGGGDVEGVVEDAPDHRLPLEQAISIARETCRGLQFAHSRGIVHRDLKPGNVWLTGDGVAKIGDFGLAVAIDRSRLTTEGMMVGTVSYMPPEQATGGEVTPRSDLYSLGAMLYEMVTGRPPFLGDDSVAIIGQHINTPPVAPTWHNPQCPRALEALIMRLLAKNPAERPESATDVLAALESVDLTASVDVPQTDEAHPLDSLAGGVFVGRQREIGELKACLEDVLSGRGRLVTLVGEPGIGKTRTAQELATYAGLRGAQVLWGRCYEEQGMPPYWPWVQAIRSYVRERDPQQLRSEMGAGAADIAEVVSDVKERLPDLPAPPHLESPEQARFRLFDSITAFLKSASQKQCLVLVLDDLHWADQPSLLLLQFAARELGNSRVLVVGTYRDVELSRQHPLAETLGELTRERLFQRVLLRGLTQQDVGRFIEITTGVAPPVSLTQAVHTQTEGNPLFVTEVVRLLAQEGALTQANTGDRDSWSMRIPEGVREVIGRRLNRLSQRCNETLTIASVIGREFTLEQLRPLIDDVTEDRLLEVMEEALTGRVIEELPQAVGRYQFTHALIQETLTDELTLTRRVRLHAKIAETLEQLYTGNLEAHASELAHHFAEAEAALGTDKLVQYSLLAGERALSAYAYEEALTHFQRALHAKEGEAMDGEQAASRFGLGRAQTATAEWHQAQDIVANLKSAFDYYFSVGNITQAVSVAEFPVPTNTLRLPDIASMIEKALTLVPPDSITAGRLLARFSIALYMGSGDPEGAREASARALAIAERENDTVLQMRVLTNEGRASRYYSRSQEGLPQVLRAIALAREVDDPYTEMTAQFYASRLCTDLGDHGGAHRHVESALTLAERLRDHYFLAGALQNCQHQRQQLGDWASALGYSDRGLAVAPSDPRLLNTRTHLEYELGRFSEGASFLERLLEVMRLSPTAVGPEYAGPAILIPTIARITGQHDLLGVAEDAARALLEAKSATPLTNLSAWGGLGLISVLRQDLPLAREMYTLLETHRGTDLYSYLRSDTVLALLAQTLGDCDQAVVHFEDMLLFIGESGKRPQLAWTSCDYADTLLKRNNPGDREKAVSLLDQALAISSELGMRPLMERVLSRRDILKA